MIEDVHLLSSLLTPDLIKSAADIKYAFKAYDNIILPGSQDLVIKSRVNGLLMDLQSEEGGNVTAETLKMSLPSNMR